jgi:hypothetical protein
MTFVDNTKTVRNAPETVKAIQRAIYPTVRRQVSVV